MVSHAINGHEKQSPTFSAWVWFGGSTALEEGQAVCYNYDYGTASAKDGRRFNRVELPSTTNAQYFAGVAARKYAAVTGGQLIEIYLPGSVCNIYAKASCTLGTGLLTFDVTTSYQGYFRYEGLDGEGSAQPMQTVDRSTDAGLVYAKLQVGPPSGGVEVVQLVDNTAFVMMVGGTSLLIGAACSTASPAEEIVDGTIEGLRKKVEIITTAVTSNEARIDIENDDGNEPADGTQDLDGLELGGVGDQCVLEWVAGSWNIRGANGVVLVS